MAEVTTAAIAPLLGDIAIYAPFGLAFLLVGMIQGRTRSCTETA